MNAADGRGPVDRIVGLTPEAMKPGGRYNWKGQPERLIYVRKFNGWHQFRKVGDHREVWCEVLDADLRMLEETAGADTLPASEADTNEC